MGVYYNGKDIGGMSFFSNNADLSDGKIVQIVGNNETAVMSQKSVTENLLLIENAMGADQAILDLTQYDIQMGTILGTGAVNAWATNRVHTNAFIDLQNVSTFKVYIADGWKYGIVYYPAADETSYNWNSTGYITESKEFNTPTTEKYMRIVLGKTDDTDITVDEALAAITVIINNEIPVKLSVGTFNIGHFCKGQGDNPAGTEDEKISYRKVISDMRCDVIGITENDEYYDAALTETSYNAVYSMFKHYKCSSKNSYDCYGVLSDYALSNEKRAYYTDQHWQGRGYYKCEFTVAGKTVAFFSTQFEWSDKTIRRQQIAELITEANKYKYAVIVGDFNPNNRTDGQIPEGGTDQDVYEEDYAIWTNAGYSLANAGYYGALNTIASTEGTVVSPWDGIIVSGNIFIKSVEVIKNDFLTDHYPVRADLVIY